MTNLTLTEDELYEAEYKIANCIRITTTPDQYMTEVNTGLRWVPIVDYVQGLIANLESSDD